MEANEVLIESFSRVQEQVHGVLDGIDHGWLTRTPVVGVNSIGWLVWHIARGQDIQIAMLIDGGEQEWVTGKWAPRFGLEPDPWNMGYGHTPEQVAAVQPESAQALLDYYDAVWARTKEMLAGVTSADLDRVVDENWDPPVTMGVRLVSIVDDDVQHAGQAWYLRGLFERSQ
jgi:uncharacterized damage-inducible protein DinB